MVIENMLYEGFIRVIALTVSGLLTVVCYQTNFLPGVDVDINFCV